MDVGKRRKELVSSTTQYQFQGPFTSSSLIPATLNRRRPLSGRIWQRAGSPLELVMMAAVDWSITVPALGLHWRRVIDSHELPYRAQTHRLLSGTHSLIHTRSLGCWLSRGRPSNLQLCPALPREPSPACPAGPTETNEGLFQHLIHYGESRDRSGKHCQRTLLF